MVKYSRMPAHTLLKDVEAMQPLYSIIFRFFRFLPVSNFYSETVVKTLVKTLHPTQRREEATASRWVAALHRDPSRLARLTTSAVYWARGVLKRRKQEAAQRREAPSATKQHGSRDPRPGVRARRAYRDRPQGARRRELRRRGAGGEGGL